MIQLKRVRHTWNWLGESAYGLPYGSFGQTCVIGCVYVVTDYAAFVVTYALNPP
jgi:hypothetical protein